MLPKPVHVKSRHNNHQQEQVESDKGVETTPVRARPVAYRMPTSS